MRKLLLIGKLNEIARSLNECLRNDFQVQLCSEQLDDIRGMYKIVKPDIVLVSQVEAEDLDEEVMKWLQKQKSHTPVLLIANWENRHQYDAYEADGAFEKLFRPVGKRELLEKCYLMLKMKTPESYQENRFVGKKKILLVDDSPVLLRNIKSILSDTYTVYLATSGEQALNFVPEKKPDLILLDYEMPGLDGKMTYEKLKEMEEAKDIPVIFLTSVAGREKVFSALKEKPAGYILKPPDKERLFRSIKEALKE